MRRRAVICVGRVELFYGITGTRNYSEQMSNPPRLMGMRSFMLSVDEWCRAILNNSFRPPAITDIEICNYKYQAPLNAR